TKGMLEQSHLSRCIIIDASSEKKLIRKIDFHLMPSIFILYLFSYMDRSNIGLTKIAGMEEDLHLTSHQYYTAVIVWVIGYTISAVPSNMILCRTRPSVLIPIITFAWGTVAALIGAVRHQSQLVALRFLLGVFEAGFRVSDSNVFHNTFDISEASCDLLDFNMVSKERAVCSLIQPQPRNITYSKQIKTLHHLPNRRYTPRSLRRRNIRSHHIDIGWQTRYPRLEMAVHYRKSRNCRSKLDRPLDSTRLPAQQSRTILRRSLIFEY
ncbi:hypothetical protein N7517_011155, partial [Penicillium concentricum]